MKIYWSRDELWTSKFSARESSNELNIFFLHDNLSQILRNQQTIWSHFKSFWINFNLICSQRQAAIRRLHFSVVLSPHSFNECRHLDEQKKHNSNDSKQCLKIIKSSSRCSFWLNHFSCIAVTSRVSNQQQQVSLHIRRVSEALSMMLRTVDSICFDYDEHAHSTRLHMFARERLIVRLHETFTCRSLPDRLKCLAQN